MNRSLPCGAYEAQSLKSIGAGTLLSGKVLNETLRRWEGEHLLLVVAGGGVEISAAGLDRLRAIATDSGAGLIYSDYWDRVGDEIVEHPTIDYQLGSIRDNFDFGGLVLLSRQAVTRALEKCGRVADDLRSGAFYDLRLKVSEVSEVRRVPELISTRIPEDRRATGERVFDYIDPRQRDYQLEMERIATEHLTRIGACLAPAFEMVPPAPERFEIMASVIIPVRNRVRTIAEAVGSALSQRADFAYNVIVVDNHSTDGTTALLARLASDNARLIHLIPEAVDLGIGGCWREAIFSRHCGRYAVQLDSDDVYAGESTLARLVETFGEGPYAMVIGSYTTVDFDLQVIAPGLVDHREWTPENGRNNALRVNGLGAPRAFDVSILRRVGIPNVSYGEDYAVALRISRNYQIGRIYDSIYHVRRWSDNTDSALPLVKSNRYDHYKDSLRTVEILARRALNEGRAARGRP
jgi:hypothetical protein